MGVGIRICWDQRVGGIRYHAEYRSGIAAGRFGRAFSSAVSDKSLSRVLRLLRVSTRSDLRGGSLKSSVYSGIF